MSKIVEEAKQREEASTVKSFNFDSMIDDYDDTTGRMSIKNINSKRQSSSLLDLDNQTIVMLLGQLSDRIECLDKRLDKLDEKIEKFNGKMESNYEKLENKIEEKTEKVSEDIKETNNRFSKVDETMDSKFEKINNEKRDRLSILISVITLLILIFTTFFRI